MLDSIDTSVGSLDDLIQGDEGCLQRCKLHQQVDSFLIIGLQSMKILQFTLNVNMPASPSTSLSAAPP